MSRLLLRLIDIMRFRAGPQDLPGGWGFAVIFMVIYGLMGAVTDRMLDGAEAAPRSLFSLMVQVCAGAALLWLRRVPSRLPQTISALAGTGIVFGFITILLLLQVTPQGFPQGLGLIWLGIFLWSLFVDAHIYRHALSITMSLGVLVAVTVFALNFLVIEALFPAPAGSG
ncbi:hypothetical protein [Elongatibacter sediminis]|uniref:Tripartite tricarboxylate transporter TctB family protein n=1 Tax=Elongatibacter sediminis TaxID=3119006 RepID=A0AAW9RA50_9GAMM